MLDRIAIAWRWTIHHGSMIVGFFCLAFYEVWPSWRGGWWTKIGHSILPWAGDYAYADDPWCREVNRHWIATGRNLNAEDIGQDPFSRAIQTKESGHDQ